MSLDLDLSILYFRSFSVNDDECFLSRQPVFSLLRLKTLWVELIYFDRPISVYGTF